MIIQSAIQYLADSIFTPWDFRLLQNYPSFRLIQFILRGGLDARYQQLGIARQQPSSYRIFGVYVVNEEEKEGIQGISRDLSPTSDLQTTDATDRERPLQPQISVWPRHNEPILLREPILQFRRTFPRASPPRHRFIRYLSYKLKDFLYLFLLVHFLYRTLLKLKNCYTM